MIQLNNTPKIYLATAIAIVSLTINCTSRLIGAEHGESAIFTTPSSEMVDVSQSIGVPFGGIGTGFSVFGKYGFVDVYFDGRRLNDKDWRIDRAPMDPPTFAFQLSEGNSRTVLQQTSVTWLADAQPVDEVKAYADLPKGYFVFKKAGWNLGLSMIGFSPMVPHDLANSTVPVQVYEITLENQTDQPRSCDLALLNRDPLKVQGQSAVLVDPLGEIAFACDGGSASTNGVKTTVKLAPKGRQTVRFYISWDYPAIKPSSKSIPQTYKRYYTKTFKHANEVIDLAMKSADIWSAAIDRWHDSYDVPSTFKRLWFSGLCSVSTSTILTDDSYFFEQEVPHGFDNTMDVSVYHNWLYMVNWPEIEHMDMSQYYTSIATTGSDAGFVWHSLWKDGSNYAEEPTFIGRVYRDSLWFNDTSWTKEGFKLAGFAANHAYDKDHYQGLLFNRGGNQSYDVWKMPGINSYCNVMWIYALYSLDRMSQLLDQPTTVGGKSVAQMFSQARQNLNDILWNPDGYWNTFFVPTDHDENPAALKRTDGKDTFSDQLFGKWVLLLDPQSETVLPSNKVHSALMMIYTNNLVNDPAKGFRGWANGMRPGHQPEMKVGYHSRTCWFGPQEALASLLADDGDEEKSLDVFNSLETSLHDDDMFVGEWNKSAGPDGLSRTLPEEPRKDTPRFPPYPRYKSSWEYLRAILGLKMDAQTFYLNPFKTIGFTLTHVELAGTDFTITVQRGWTKVLVNGKSQSQINPVQIPRSEHQIKLEFIR